MSTIEPPFIDRRGRPGDDVDGLLTAFFKSELPAPWPDAPIPEKRAEYTNGHVTIPFAPPVRPARPTAQPWRLSGRLALAASLGGLLVGTLLLSGQFQGNSPVDPKTYGPESGDLNRVRESLDQPVNGPTRFRMDFDQGMPEGL